MSEFEADRYTCKSFYAKVDFYHGTSQKAAKSITSIGVAIDKNRIGILGKGFYISDDLEVASEYADFDAPAYISVRILASNPKIFETSIEAEIFFRKNGGASDKQKTNLLRSLGYDAVEVKDTKYLVVFDALQVAVFGVKNL